MSEPVPGPSRASSLLSFPSPKKKRVKRGPLPSSEKQILINVFKYVEESWPRDKYPYKKDIVTKTSEIMGVSIPTVYSVLKEYKTTHRVQSPPTPSVKPKKMDALDDMDFSGIRRKVHQFFFNNEMPTINKVLESINNDDSLPTLSRDVLYQVLKKLGFRYAKRNRKSMLIDKPEIVDWRFNYLTDMAKFRKDGKNIYYLDETWVNEGHTKSSIWQDTTVKSSKEAHLEGLSTGLKNPSGKGKRLILAHVGSSTGFVEEGELIFQAVKGEGDYHSEMNATNFEKWFKTILPKLEKGSVLVMDNASYHSRRAEKVPTTETRKADIQKWLKEKNIPFGEKELKGTLILKVRKVRHKYQTYVVDELAKQHGVTILRLPPYHCELNPIEMIWAQVKGYVAQKNTTFKMADIKKLLPEALQSVTSENWAKCEEHVRKEEERMMVLDHIIDETEERFIINVGDTSSSSSASSTSEYNSDSSN